MTLTFVIEKYQQNFSKRNRKAVIQPLNRAKSGIPDFARFFGSV